MENYYRILELDQYASQETIEKVYKLLVKKYHPDLQSEDAKHIYEEKIKKINEAYDVLSNPEKRKQYDNSLSNDTVSIKEYNKIANENVILKRELNNIKEKLDIISQYYNSYSGNNKYSPPKNNYYSTNNTVNNYTYNHKPNRFFNKLFKVIGCTLIIVTALFIVLQISPDPTLFIIILLIVIIYYSSKR